MKIKTRYKAASLIVLLGVLTYAALIGSRIITYTKGTISHQALMEGLQEAIIAKDLTAMRVLIALGADPNIFWSSPPLTTAVWSKNQKAVTLLLDRGANPNGHKTVIDASDVRGSFFGPDGLSHIYTVDRPMFVAGLRGDHEMADLLKARGARYEPADALLLGDEATARDALAKDPEVFSITKYRNSLLSRAVEAHNVDAIRLMLKLGMDPNEKNQRGYSAFDTAKAARMTDIIQIFEEHGKQSAAK